MISERVKTITLSSGKKALVSAEDYCALLNRPCDPYVKSGRIKWHERTNFGKVKRSPGMRYAFCNLKVNGKWRNVKMHRFIFPEWPLIDHINGDGLDNRRSNLRPCTQKQNLANSKPRGNRKYKGVSRCGNKWRAYIVVDAKQKHLGLFGSPLEAAIAYNKAATILFRDFARLNEVPL